MQNYKKHRKLSEYTCNQCGIQDLKPNSELKRNQKLNRRNFCSRKCSMTAAQLIANKIPTRNRYNIATHSDCRRDKYTAFRYILSSAKRRFKEFSITLDDLKYQWELQSGRCPYSNIQLELPTNTGGKIHPSVRASLDRIDSSKGYVKDNIQFVSTMINYMKSSLPEEDVLRFRDQLIKNYCPCYQED